MRTIKKGIAALLCAAMVITLAPAGSADAAKKPKLKKKVSVKVGNTVTIKVKNASKKAKVTWKTSKKSVAKLVKKKTVKKGKKACAVVKGVSAGKAKITAVYKLGKKKTSLKSTVTVTNESTVIPNGTPTSPVAPTNNPNATPGSTDKASGVTDVPKTKAPKTEAPPTEEPSPKPERPTVTNDPYASELVVPMTKANQAFAAEEATYNEDGTVDVALEPADSGHGICWYFNAEKLSVDLTDYDKLVISYNAKDEYAMAISLKEYIPDTAAESYWDGADGNKCPAIGGEQYTTFSKGDGEYEFDISGIKETAGGVFVKYNTYNAGDAASLPKAELTIKSIKLIRDSATVSTQPPATEEPGPDTSASPDTSAEPEASASPDTSAEPEASASPDTSAEPEASASPDTSAEPEASAEPTEEPAAYDVDLSSEDSYINDGNVTASYADDVLDVTLSQFTGIVFKADGDGQYKYVQVTYTTEANNISVYLFDNNFTDGKGQTAAGQQNTNTNLETSSEDKTVTYQVGDGYAGECLKAIKLVHADFGSGDAKSVKIKSVKFFEENPEAAEPTEEPSAEPSEEPSASKDVDIQDESNYKKMGTDTVVTNNEDGSITLTSEAGSDGLMVKLPDGMQLKSGDSIKIHLEVADLEGSSTDARVYLIPGENDTAKSNQLHSNEQGIIDDVLTATDNVDHIFIKVAAYGQKFNKLTVKKLTVTPIESGSTEEPQNVTLDLNTIQITDGSTKEVQGDGSVVITCKGNYTGGITIAIPAELQEGAKRIVIEIDAEKAGEKVGSGQLKCEFDGADTVEVYNWNASSYDDTVFDVTGKKPTKLIINNQEEGIKLTIKKIEVQK